MFCALDDAVSIFRILSLVDDGWEIGVKCSRWWQTGNSSSMIMLVAVEKLVYKASVVGGRAIGIQRFISFMSVYGWCFYAKNNHIQFCAD